MDRQSTLDDVWANSSARFTKLGFDCRRVARKQRATLSDQPRQPDGEHHQIQMQPLEPVPRLEAAQSHGLGRSDSARVGHYDH